MQELRSRNGIIVGLLSLGLLAGVTLTASLIQAASSNGPYYAEPSWDQKLPATTRFVVLLDWNSEAVLDRETGLVWEQSPASTLHTWFSAREACMKRKTGLRNGWRLPSVHELASLLDSNVAIPGPTLPAGHPFTLISGAPGGFLFAYWSATSDAAIPNFAWDMSLNFGQIDHHEKTVNNAFAWCVRGGGPLSEY